VSVPLARRNLLANTPRLIRSVSGIAFAVLLMLIELGFRDGFFESMIMNVRALDGDIMLTNSAKYQVDRISPFSRRHLYEARAVPGVASASPSRSIGQPRSGRTRRITEAKRRSLALNDWRHDANDTPSVPRAEDRLQQWAAARECQSCEIEQTKT
jgi:hypothetical protein